MRSCDKAYEVFHTMGLTIESFTVNTPVSGERDAKRLHYLGFKQLMDSYAERGGADLQSLAQELKAYESCIESESVYVELYKLLQFVARK